MSMKPKLNMKEKLKSQFEPCGYNHTQLRLARLVRQALRYISNINLSLQHKRPFHCYIALPSELSGSLSSRANMSMDSSLITLINKLQDTFNNVGIQNPIDLPQITVLGSQSS